MVYPRSSISNGLGGRWEPLIFDPASHPLAQARVRATQFFTQEDDGLKREWHGRVWLNPPYSQPLTRTVRRQVAA